MKAIKLVLILALAPAIALADPEPRMRSPQADTNTRQGSATQEPQHTSDANTQTDHAPFGLSVKADASGLIVTDVESGSPAADAGIKTGDIIKKVDNTPVADAGDLAHAWNADQISSTPQAVFQIQRDQQTIDVQAKLQPGAQP